MISIEAMTFQQGTTRIQSTLMMMSQSKPINIQVTNSIDHLQTSLDVSSFPQATSAGDFLCHDSHEQHANQFTTQRRSVYNMRANLQRFQELEAANSKQIYSLISVAIEDFNPGANSSILNHERSNFFHRSELDEEENQNSSILSN